MTSTRVGRTISLAGRGLRRAPAPVQKALVRGSNRLIRAVDLPALNGGDPNAAWVDPPVPLPAGVTLAELETTFSSWAVNDEPVGHMDHYLADSFQRFCHTWNLVRDEKGECLELGANPYFTTYLLDRHTDLNVSMANYYGSSGEVTETLSYQVSGEPGRTELDRHCLLFNVEEEPFPYPDDSFDVVLFCEMLEHMLMNPIATLREIHRVLKPGAVMVLTTPNVARLVNVLALTNGANMYDPYSGYGPYGRHNREYTRHELHRLLDFMGFEIETSVTADGHRSDESGWPLFDQVSRLVSFRGNDLGHYLFLRARAVREPRPGLPSFLFRSYPPGEIVDYA